ncbi:hypothetical protein [Hymenobacter sublimis]|uniref:Uncharacterized protein n=1 Tax=Hymenobacter sublimis TaxID=2933777 RepID=A0ABY4J891_9BACT|nr:hypothetical protein [Hymenobacter sublimis]UPL47624.1 hypothetical protein MWH26_10485 [Hymenobacter sublimis]
MLLNLSDLQVQYRSDVSLLRVQWRAPHQRMTRFQEGMNAVVYLLELGVVHTAILDLHYLPNISLDDQYWLATNWLPRISVPALQQVGVVLPSSNLYNQLVVESLIHISRHFMHYDIQFFGAAAEALDWSVGSQQPDLQLALESEWAAYTPGPLPH